VSRLSETQRAYDRLSKLLDQEIRKRSGSTKDLEQFRETLDVAFYLLGWAQFEHLVREEAKDLIDINARAHSVERHAWQYLKENLRNFPVRSRLDLIFHANPVARDRLKKDYDVRNDAAHDYKYLPKEAKDVSAWLQSLEDLVNKF
jgi:hypothetical protein